MNKPTIGHYASHQRDVTAQEDAALNAALRSSTIKVEHPEIARLLAELAECRRDAERYRWIIRNMHLSIAQNGAYWSLTDATQVAPNHIGEVDATIDAALRGEGDR